MNFLKSSNRAVQVAGTTAAFAMLFLCFRGDIPFPDAFFWVCEGAMITGGAVLISERFGMGWLYAIMGIVAAIDTHRAEVSRTHATVASSILAVAIVIMTFATLRQVRDRRTA